MNAAVTRAIQVFRAHPQHIKRPAGGGIGLRAPWKSGLRPRIRSCFGQHRSEHCLPQHEAWRVGRQQRGNGKLTSLRLALNTQGPRETRSSRETEEFGQPSEF